MHVPVNQMTGIPFTDEVEAAGIETANVLKELCADKLQATAQELGFEKTKFVVAELLFGLISEEAVALALEIVQAEHDRMEKARTTPVQGTPFL